MDASGRAIAERAAAIPAAASPEDWVERLRTRRRRGGLYQCYGRSLVRANEHQGGAFVGLNLCWRDVDQLHRLARRCGDGRLRPRSLAGAYGRARVLDIALVLLATDALVRLFSNRFAPLLLLRRLALQALGRWGWMRQLSLRAMSDGPCRLWRG